ncbi:DME family drug/metabolite transporter [Melghirimyces profundicolus]|uniref:DME family drug/metabolite transporter n=1 Tax=Melghirimyces profundicolus TaxID=1242148 RepID=A0A2T6BXR5_9BACL|nr:DMT family transporter [Melghirimyces profundicolus]PTX60816.1 DME family drug/metabolite transporter [Melghirimyces profundicolus]
MRRGNGMSWVFLGAFLWGTAGLVGKVLIVRHGLDSMVVGAWRLVFSVPFLVTAALLERKRHPGRLRERGRPTGWLLLFGLAVAGYQVGYFSAVDRTQVATATMLAVCTAPLMVAVFARVFMKERIGGWTAVSLVAGLTGTLLLIGVGSVAGLAEPRYLSGNLLALFAASCYGGYTLIGKHLLAGIPPFRMLAITFSLGACFLLPMLRMPEPSLEAWLLLLYVGAVPTALAYLCYIYGLKRTTATRASIGALTEPLTAALLAVLLLGERLTALGWAGAGLLFSSLALMQWTAGENRNEAPAKTGGLESGPARK